MWHEKIDPKNRPPLRSFLWAYAAAFGLVLLIGWICTGLG